MRLTLDDMSARWSVAIARGTEIARAMQTKVICHRYRHLQALRHAPLSIHPRAGRHHHDPSLGEYSVVNTTGQHWRAPNLFIMESSILANNSSSKSTPTVLAFTYRTADAVIDRYLKKPGQLA